MLVVYTAGLKQKLFILHESPLAFFYKADWIDFSTFQTLPSDIYGSSKNNTVTMIPQPKQEYSCVFAQPDFATNAQHLIEPLTLPDSFQTNWIPFVNATVPPIGHLETVSIQLPIQKAAPVNVSQVIASKPNCDVVLIRQIQSRLYKALSSNSTSQHRKSSKSTNNVPSHNVKTKIKPIKTKLKSTSKSKANNKTLFKKKLSPVACKEGSTNTDFALEKINEKLTSESFCFVCNVTCGSAELLLLHKQSKDYFCRVCTQQFSDHTKLESHFTSHKTYSCKVCTNIFYSKQDYFQHTKKVEACFNLVECDICNKKFSRKNMSSHKKYFHSSHEAYKCMICSSSCYSSSSLVNHLKKVHSPYEDMDCQICNKVFWGPLKLKHHILKVHVEPKQDNDDFLLSCQNCNKICKGEKALESHILTHDESDSMCDICGKSVKVKSMKRHMQKEHPKTGTFPCKRCNEKFETHYKMRQHIKESHNFVRVHDPVYCEICGKKLSSLFILKNHIRTHSEEKPYRCNTCGATFKQRVTLNNHKRVHSSPSKYFCNGCGMAFKWKQTFSKHVEKCKNIQENSVGENMDSN